MRVETEPTNRRLRAGGLAVLGLALSLWGCSTPTSTVSARVAVHGTVGWRAGAIPQPLVVFVEPAERIDSASPPAAPVSLSIRTGVFSPELRVVAAGQSVEFASDDGLLHRFFSYDEPNRFDLPAGGAQRSRITLEHPGLVHFYCSLHPSEGGTIFVAPSPYFAVARRDGHFHIDGIPPGRYRVKSWSAKTAETQQTILLGPREVERVEISLELAERATQ